MSGFVQSGRFSSAFTPSSSASLALWLDASNAGSFTYGTGTQVASWADLSTNGYTVSRTPSADVTRSGTIGGLSAVDMTADRTLDRATVNVRSLFDSSAFTNVMSFAVIEVDSTARAAWMSLVGASSRFSCAMSGGSSNFFDIANTGTARLSGTVGYTTATPFLMSIYRNGATIKVRHDGVEKLSRTDASGAAANETATLKIGHLSGFTWLDGRIGEIVHVAGYDAAYFANCEAYLRAKWGTP